MRSLEEHPNTIELKEPERLKAGSQMWGRGEEEGMPQRPLPGSAGFFRRTDFCGCRAGRPLSAPAGEGSVQSSFRPECPP